MLLNLNKPGLLSISRTALYLIVSSLAFRALLAYLIPLGTDEAYAIAVGRSFSISFFDHPPVSFWLPALMEWFFSSVDPIVIRLPSLILGSLTLLFFYHIGFHFAGEKGAILSLSALALSPISLIGGVLMVPDAPLYFGLAGAAVIILQLMATNETRLSLWLLGGSFTAVALASKYQAGLFVISVFVWVLSSRDHRKWLKFGCFWIAVFIATIGLLPILIWNLENDWASFRFHTGRAGSGLDIQNFLKMLVAQSIYVFPTLLVFAIVAAFKNENWRVLDRRLFLLLGLLPVAMFNTIYLVSSGTLPHWTLPGWIFLLPLAALTLTELTRKQLNAVLVVPAIMLQIVFLLAALHLKWGVLSSWNTDTPKWDDTAPLIDHSQAREVLATKPYLRESPLVFANSWLDAGHLSVALGPGVPIRVLGDDKRHFRYMQGDISSGSSVLMKISTLQKSDVEMNRLLAFAREADPGAFELDRVVLKRGARDYFVILVVFMNAPAMND